MSQVLFRNLYDESMYIDPLNMNQSGRVQGFKRYFPVSAPTECPCCNVYETLYSKELHLHDPYLGLYFPLYILQLVSLILNDYNLYCILYTFLILGYGTIIRLSLGRPILHNSLSGAGFYHQNTA